MINKETISFCAPITSSNLEELKKDLDQVKKEKDIKIIEYRRDFLDSNEEDEILDYLKEFKDKNNIEIIYTFRNPNEGGNLIVDESDRIESINKALLKNVPDYVDIEENYSDLFFDAIEDEELGEVKIIKSFHNFDETPLEDLILEQLMLNNSLSDIVKVAYKINSLQDLLSLRQAAKEFRDKFPDKPLIVIGMGEKGIFTRIFPEIVNSNLSFAPIDEGNSSAPGQINYSIIKTLRNSFDEKEKAYIFNRDNGIW